MNDMPKVTALQVYPLAIEPVTLIAIPPPKHYAIIPHY